MLTVGVLPELATGVGAGVSMTSKQMSSKRHFSPIPKVSSQHSCIVPKVKLPVSLEPDSPALVHMLPLIRHSRVSQGVGAGVVGASVGSGVGSGVGSDVGPGVGSGVGSEVGSGVGLGVGSSVGSGVGSTVGFLLGLLLGLRVGFKVGSGVITSGKQTSFQTHSPSSNSVSQHSWASSK